MPQEPVAWALLNAAVVPYTLRALQTIFLVSSSIGLHATHWVPSTWALLSINFRMTAAFEAAYAVRDMFFFRGPLL